MAPLDADSVVKAFGLRIAQLRRERGLSQAAFAERLRSSSQWVSQVERGTRSSTLHTMVKLANALDVPLAELLVAPSDDTEATFKGK